MKFNHRRSFMGALTFALMTSSLILLPFQSWADEPKTVPAAKETKETAVIPASKLTETQLRAKLTPEQYKVTQQNGTETAYKNPFWDNHKAGIYVDVVSGEPLFSSTDKFDSGTGWPSFKQTLVKENVVQKTDSSLGIDRTEVRSKSANSHLGHVFDDGPAPTGLRYCINSAALRFVPKDKLQAEGFGQYLPLFEKKK